MLVAALLLGVCCSSGSGGGGVQAFVLPSPSSSRPGAAVAVPRGRTDLQQLPQAPEAQQQAEGSQRQRGGYGRQSVIMMPSSEPAVRWAVGMGGVGVGMNDGRHVG